MAFLRTIEIHPQVYYTSRNNDVFAMKITLKKRKETTGLLSCIQRQVSSLLDSDVSGCSSVVVSGIESDSIERTKVDRNRISSNTRWPSHLNLLRTVELLNSADRDANCSALARRPIAREVVLPWSRFPTVVHRTRRHRTSKWIDSKRAERERNSKKCGMSRALPNRSFPKHTIESVAAFSRHFQRKRGHNHPCMSHYTWLDHVI